MNVVIEIPEGSDIKMEAACSSDPSLAGVSSVKFRVDRKVDVPFPVAYGFVYGTISEDGDPQDAWVITRREVTTGQFLPQGTLFYVGKIDMLDDGISDPKKVYFLNLGENQGSLKASQIIFILQKLSFILCHLKIYKIKSNENELLQNSRISLKGLVLNPFWAERVLNIHEILPYPELITIGSECQN